MKAILHRKYGSTSNLNLEDIPKPKPKADEVLIKTEATSVNSWDWDMIIGKPYIYRLLFGIFRPRHSVIGCDVAGTVENIGEDVIEFKIGDRVFGDLSDSGWGGFAEYTTAKVKFITRIPDNVSFEDAAAIPHAGILALQGLRYNGKIKTGESVLINGAGGGVGTLGVQMAKWWGAEVTVVDRGDKLDTLKELGADHVIDYTKENYTEMGIQYDLVVDVTARKPFKEYEKVVKKGGSFSVVGGTVKTLLQTAIFGKRLSKKTGKKLGIMGQKLSTEDLDYLISKVAEGKLKPVISKTYPLEKTPEALQVLGDGNGIGKLVIKIG